MQEYDPSTLDFLFNRKILFRMSHSFFTGAQFGESTSFVVLDSKLPLRRNNAATSNKWREFTRANKYYNIIDISMYDGTFRTCFARGSAVTLRCSGRHYDFTHWSLTLNDGCNCAFRTGHLDCKTPPCRLTSLVNPDPDWYRNLNFRDYFEINDRHYGSSDPDNYDDVANLVRFDSGIELN